MTSDPCIGIDNSGAHTADWRHALLQVEARREDETPVAAKAPANRDRSSRKRSSRNWSRREIANLLIEQALTEESNGGESQHRVCGRLGPGRDLTNVDERSNP